MGLLNAALLLSLRVCAVLGCAVIVSLVRIPSLLRLLVSWYVNHDMFLF